MLRRATILAVLVLLLAAVATAAQVSHVSPTDALSISPSARSRPMATSTAVASNEPSPPGGLGNTRIDLETVYGDPTGLQGTMIAYHKGRYAATYVNRRATAILVSYGSAPSSLAMARKAAAALIPSDSVFVGTLNAGPSRIADVYQSKKLGEKVAPPTDGVPRGQFAVVYETDRSAGVKNVLLTVGGVQLQEHRF